jgi:hypothetical protein
MANHIYSRTNPIGIDFRIVEIQSKIYKYLTEKRSWDKYNCYDRAYINTKNNQIIPEVYVGNKEYNEVLLNDKINALTYFIVNESRTYDKGFRTTISLIFEGNLSRLYPAITHRADEELHKDLFNALYFAFNGGEIKQLITGIDNVYKEFNFSTIAKEKINTHNIGSYHVCRIDFEIIYKYCKS